MALNYCLQCFALSGGTTELWSVQTVRQADLEVCSWLGPSKHSRPHTDESVSPSVLLPYQEKLARKWVCQVAALFCRRPRRRLNAAANVRFRLPFLILLNRRLLLISNVCFLFILFYFICFLPNSDWHTEWTRRIEMTEDERKQNKGRKNTQFCLFLCIFISQFRQEYQ